MLFRAALLAAVLAAGCSPALASTVFINELHYDNTGPDTGEAVEIAGPALTNLDGWSVVLYNGTWGASYATIPLSGFRAVLRKASIRSHKREELLHTLEVR
jgi:hypothetical protein